MKKNTWVIMISLVFLLAAIPALADDTLIQSITDGCNKELNTYCKDVTPGQGRGLACLYAHGDKLSSQCEYALYDAAAQLERAVAALAYVANECGDDLDKLCQDVPIGGGRLLDCLDKNAKKVSKRCNEAIKEVGLK
jgi:hypothetical protein